MTLSSGAKTVYTEYGVSERESLFDYITNIDVYDTPFLSALPKGSTNEIYTSWLQESLSTFQSNSHTDAETYTFSARSARTRIGNWVQYFQDTWKVGRIMEAVDEAGVKSEYQHEMQLALKEHSTDIEYALVYGTSASGASATVSTLRGIDSWISTYSATGSSSASFTETAFNALCQSVVTATSGKPNDVYLSPNLKRQVSSYTTGNTRFVNAEDGRLAGFVDIYAGDFGVYKCQWDRWLTGAKAPSDNYDRAFFMDKSKWEILTLSPTKAEEIAPDGYYRAGVVNSVLTLRCLQEAASAKYLAST